MGPIDYSLDVESPFNAIAKGYQLGAGIRENELKQQQEQAALEQQRMLNEDLHRTSLDPTPQAIASLAVKYPQLGDKLKAGFEMMDSQQKESKIQTAVPIYAAIQSGDYKVALNKLEEQATAYDNVGDTKQADSTRAIAKMVESHPENAKFTLGMYLSQAMGPKEFANTFSQLQKTQQEQIKLPYETSKLAAETEKANIEAANLPEKQMLEKQKLYEDIETSKLDKKIKVLDAQIKKANSETEREKLQLEKDKTVATLEEKRTAKTEAAQTVMDSTTEGIKLVNDLLADPDTLKAITGASAWKGSIPGTDNKAAAGKWDQLANLLAFNNIDKLPGAMSDKDVMFLKQINANMDRYQSEGMAEAELRRVKGALERVQKKYAASGKLDTSSGAFVMKHPELGNITEGTINRLLRDHPEATRDDIMEWLKATGGE